MKIPNVRPQRESILKPKLAKRVIAANGAALLLWLLSLPMEVFVLANPQHSYNGIEVLIVGTLFGWAGGKIGYLAVYANYCALTLMLPVRWSARAVAVLTASMWLLALLTFTLDAIILDEAGHHSDIVAYGAGLYLWFSSLAVLTLGRLSGMWQREAV